MMEVYKDPRSGMLATRVVAIRPIFPGSEILLDYSEVFDVSWRYSTLPQMPHTLLGVAINLLANAILLCCIHRY